MIRPLQQITGLIENKPLSEIQLLKTSTLQIDKILHVQTRQINFGECLAGSIHQKKLLIVIKQNLTEAKVIRLRINSQDQQLNSLPQYIFGVRFQNQYEYVDQLRFKVIKKGSYQFQVGVKTPPYEFYQVKSKLIVSMQETIGDPFQIKLSQIAIIPKIVCPKQLSFNGMRIIKFSQIKGKNKKQIKMLFRLQNSISVNITNQIIGLQKQLHPIIDVKPKQLSLSPKCQFILTFKFAYPMELQKHFKRVKQNQKLQNAMYSVRRLLVIKIYETKFHYHFPIQTTYYPENKKNRSENNVD